MNDGDGGATPSVAASADIDRSDRQLVRIYRFDPCLHSHAPFGHNSQYN